MKKWNQWATAAAVAAAIAGGAGLGTASAASMRTVYVNDDGPTNAASKGSCAKPNYATIQAAVDDLTVKRVLVCAGTYTEFVKVERSLTLEAKPGATIRSPLVGVDEHNAIVAFNGPQRSRISGFTISGAGSGIYAGIRTQGYVPDEGEAGPTYVSVSKNSVTDIKVGIAIYKGEANVEDNTVERYRVMGIEADGGDRAGTFAQIDGNTVRGQGAGGESETQIGIRLDETDADVEDNIISGNIGGGPDALGFGIVSEYANASIRDNTLTDNQIGLWLSPGLRNIVRSNVISRSVGNGIELTGTSAALIVENGVSGSGGDGIHLNLGAHANTLRDNRIAGSGGTDLYDANGAPLVNAYSSNHCTTSNPAGLCH